MQSKFDLEKALATWRNSLTYNRRFTTDDLDELEWHIRDQVKALIDKGKNPQEAFAIAMQEIGSYASVEKEYEKVFWGKVKRNKDLSSELAHRYSMFRNYWKIAVRSLWKKKSATVINISGLAIGMACCIVVLLFIKDESSFDTYHENAPNLYRLSVRDVEISSGDTGNNATSSILWAPAMQREYPEIEAYTRFVKFPSADNPWQLSHNNRTFFEEHILYADPSVFELFSWPLLQGNPETALSEPSTIILTESMVEKYFGDQNPLGQTITLDPRLRDNNGVLLGSSFDYQVTGVIADPPKRSHFAFDFLLPTINLNNIYGGDINTGAGLDSWFWRGRVAHTYLLLSDASAPESLASKFDDFLDRYVGDATTSRGYYYEPYLQRIDQIYLGGDASGQMAGVGDQTRLYMFSIIAFFILCIACINFTNLSTARASTRAKEVGLRKVVGAHRRHLIVQFLGESTLISLIAFLVAMLLAWIMLPIFYGYMDKPLYFSLKEDALFLSSILLLGLIVGIFAGSYPAFFLSKFRPTQVLKGRRAQGGSGLLVRKGLIVFQFIVSAFLIIATLTVFKQLEFMRTHDLGFDQERVVVLPPETARPLTAQGDAIREELRSIPEVTHVSLSSGVPGQGGGGDLYGEVDAPGDKSFALGEIFVDYDYLSLFGIELLAGRGFSTDFGTDEPLRNDQGRIREVVAIVNEAAIKRFGWSSPEEAIGKRIIRDPNAGDWIATVIGVIKDFHFQDLSQPITPGALLFIPNYNHISVKLKPGDPAGALAAIEQVVQKFPTTEGFHYNFVDETFRAQYEAEQRLGSVFSNLSFLAIFIACLGLFGLAAYTTEQRIKEIGIRKALGASIPDIVILLSKGVTRLVFIAVVLAIPISYLATERWLDLFAYRINFNPTIYILACVLAIGIALLTISYQTIKAAKLNPTDSLRYE